MVDFRGTVLYYPDTHATRTLMSKINATFNSLTTFDFNQLADRRVAMQVRAPEKSYWMMESSA